MTRLVVAQRLCLRRVRLRELPFDKLRTTCKQLHHYASPWSESWRDRKFTGTTRLHIRLAE